jgi:cellulose biosynthesis protein BcsQ
VGIIIAVVNNKAGVGKTTVACTLAHALGLMGKRALAVDLDSHCNATTLLIPKEEAPLSPMCVRLGTCANILRCGTQLWPSRRRLIYF